MLLMRYPLLLEELCAAIAEHVRVDIPVDIDAVVGLEARGKYSHWKVQIRNV